MKKILTLAALFSASISVDAMQPKMNLQCDHGRVTSSIAKVYSIHCPNRQMPYLGNAIPNPACYTTTITNTHTGQVMYKAFCPRNDDGNFPKPYIKK